MVVCAEDDMADNSATITSVVPRSVKDILAGVQKEGQKHVEESEDSDSSEEEVKSSEVRGKRPGGRFWKTDRKRFSSVVATRGLRRTTLEQKQELRQHLKHVKELSRSIKDDRARQKQEHRERRAENLKRREANARKAEVVQVISNTSKLKKMKRKHLRTIEKRDTTSMLQK